jgi:hypothetical protein
VDRGSLRLDLLFAGSLEPLGLAFEETGYKSARTDLAALRQAVTAEVRCGCGCWGGGWGVCVWVSGEGEGVGWLGTARLVGAVWGVGGCVRTSKPHNFAQYLSSTLLSFSSI